MGIINTIIRKQTPAAREINTGITDSMRRVTSRKTRWEWGDTNPFQTMLNKNDLKKYYWGNEIVYKGLNKKSRDLIFDWFEIDNPLDGEDVPEQIEKTLKEFIKTKHIKKKIYDAVLDSFKYGNGWIEYICMGNKEPEQPLNGKLTDIEYVNPETIIGYKWDETKTFIEYWIQKTGMTKTYIHHSRLAQFAFYRDGDSPFGISPLEVCKASVKADNETLEASAKNYDLFGNPILTINTTDNSNKKQVDDAFEALGRFKKKLIKVGLAGFKDTKFGILNPQSPNLAFGLNNFYIHLAAALEMPMMLLIGEQKGHLTGSEVELNDYYKSIKAIQEIHITPVINQIFTLLLGKWDYDILWNDLFVDEQTEIANQTLLMEKIGSLYNLYGLIDIIEARQLLREAGIKIPENGELDEYDPNIDTPESLPTGQENPNENLQPEQQKTFTYHYATPLEKQIQETIIKQAEMEHKLGLKELMEQEERCR